MIRAARKSGKKAAARDRGYDRIVWQKLRLMKRLRDPMCEKCERKPAQLVHHVISPEERPDLRLAMGNLMSVCRTCHAELHSQGKGRLVKKRGKLTVVCGPPASGKTTYIREHRKPGDVVWDFDVVLAAITDLPVHQCPAETITLGMELADTVVNWAAGRVIGSNVWIIVTSKAKARIVANAICGELVVLDTPEAECIRRIRIDTSRTPRQTQHIAAVRDWHKAQGAG